MRDYINTAQRSVLLKICLLGAASVIAASYFPLSRPHGEVHSLKTALDSHIPLLPVFVVPYVLFGLAFWAVLAIALILDRRFIGLCVATICVYLISYIVFLSFQTVIERPPVSGQGVFSDLIRWIYRVDRPYSAFPSLHTSTATLFAMYFWLNGAGKRLAAGMTIFSGLVIASTLLIKQHYIVDVAGGLIVGGVGGWLFLRPRPGLIMRSSGASKKPA